MKKRFITSIFIVLVTVAAVLSKLLPYNIGNYVFDIFIVAITMVASIEMCNLLEHTNKKVNKVFATFYAVIYYAISLLLLGKVDNYSIMLIQFGVLLGYFVVVFITECVKAKDSAISTHVKTAYNTIFACVYPAFFFCMMILINHMDLYAIKYFSIMFIVLILAITWLTDTFAYIVGCSVRGPKLAPKISPNKTISGSIGGLLGGMGGAMLVYAVMCNVQALSAIVTLYNFQWWHFLLFGLFGSLLGQIGDLYESKLKRNANIKDTGTIFPGHGGMLDRIDAMIFVTIFMFIALSLILL